MNFVSYAQNYEDVMLWRALREFGKGFYIDVGAQDPQEFSVTKAFYERGWRGINIEPSRRWLGKLEVQRPHDLNLGVAASSEKGTLRFYDVKDTGLSTANPEYAQRHVDAGFAVDEVDVPCETLDDICAAHDVGDVHFLKIDCEGEEDVLRGFSLEKVRPWVILVEATEPLSEKPAYEPWEKLLTGRSYHFIYDDGLNRFYIADERSDLDVAFSHPPNVFDEFIRVSEYELDAVRNEGQAAVFERDQWRDTAKFLQAENERREAALVEHRRLLEQGSSSESSERNGFLETIAFLRAENERREAALVEHRRLLEQGSSSESSERNGFLETIGFLRAENERREAALVEHRRLLEQGSSSESSERNGFLETIAFLRAENERREAALVEHRRLLEQGSSSESSERNGFLETIAFLRAENERREAALVEHRQLLGASHAEVWRLGGLIQAVHASTSWRVSWPLRASKRFLHAGTKALAGLGYRVLRWSARMLRPSLRWIAQLRWLRRIVVAVIGEDSALIVRARSFLFGASQAIDLPGGMSEPDGPDVLESLDRQGARIYQHIHAVQTNKGKGKRH